ncbi:MAG: hypothetical protein ACI8VT_001417 [Saprospiraceae bacterium]|jgi:hypothetical protein
MKNPKNTLLFFLFIITGIGVLSFSKCTNPDSPFDIKPNIDAVLTYLETQDYRNNPKWHFFPGTDISPASDTLKRLGLPVHGRWARTYVNEIAFNFLKTAVNPKAVKEPLEFPAGSFIVKENYRSDTLATTITSSESLFEVLTIMFKPDPKFKYCVTSTLRPYNGEDCYGGGWFYGFHKKVFDRRMPPEKAKMLNDSVQANVNSFCVNCHAPAFNTDYVRTLNDIRNPYAQEGTKLFCERLPEQAMQANSVNKQASPQEIQALKDSLYAYCNPAKLSPQLPEDVPFNPSTVFNLLGGAPTKEMFDCYAWKTFISLNWPNKSRKDNVPQRGEPDTSLPFNSNIDRPRVWATYKPTFEVFQPEVPNWNPKRQKWNQAQAFPKAKNCQCEDELVLTMDTKTRDVVNETGQAFAGAFGFLVDRNQKRVHYEVLFNRTEFDFLIDSSFNRAANVNLSPSGPKGELNKVDFPDNRMDSKYNQGSIEIKSAWKELCIGPDCEYSDASSLEEAGRKFYVRNLLIYDAENDSCYRAPVALIGLHIARKTYYAPQWIWITFEHKENVPPFDSLHLPATFYDPLKVAPENCWNIPFLVPDAEMVANCPNVDLNRFSPALRDQPNQLTRLVKVQEQAATQNQNFKNLIKKEGGSPFENYILVDAQWPLNGRNKEGAVNPQNCADNGIGDDCFTMVPEYLRNTVIESYMSTYCTKENIAGMDNQQFSNRSCMSCHGNAGANFSYLWLDAVSQRVKIAKE